MYDSVRVCVVCGGARSWVEEQSHITALMSCAQRVAAVSASEMKKVMSTTRNISSTPFVYHIIFHRNVASMRNHSINGKMMGRGTVGKIREFMIFLKSNMGQHHEEWVCHRVLVVLFSSCLISRRNEIPRHTKTDGAVCGREMIMMALFTFAMPHHVCI